MIPIQRRKLQQCITILYIVSSAFVVTLSHGAVGTHKWAVVLLDYCNSVGQGECDQRRTVQWMRNVLQNRHNSVVTYFDEASYNKFHIDMDFFGWIRPDVPLQVERGGYAACYPLDEDRFRMLKDQYPQIRLRSYRGFLFLIRRPTDIQCAAGTANGFSQQMRYTYTTPSRIWTRVALAGATIHPDNYSKITSSTIVHEILHTYGLQHVTAIHCNDEDIVDVTGEDCVNQAYGGLYSIMGLRSFASLPNPVNLENLGWIEQGDGLRRITRSGQYRINVLESTGRNVKALRIDIDNPFPLFDNPNALQMDRVYIHYRGFTGFDDHNVRFNLQDGTWWSPPSMDGALVHAADCSTAICTALLLDMNPEHELVGSQSGPMYGPNRVADALLYEGMTRDLIRLSIETTRVEPQFIMVRVNLGEVPTRIAVRAVTPTTSTRVRRRRTTAGTNTTTTTTTTTEQSSSVVELFDWESGWNQQIDFDTRFTEFNNSNVYKYRADFLQYLLEAKTTNVTIDDCPSSIELEPFVDEDEDDDEQETGGDDYDDYSNRDLSAWNVCTNGPLESVGIGTYDGIVYCAYEAMEFDIFLHDNDYVPCEEVRRRIL